MQEVPSAEFVPYSSCHPRYAVSLGETLKHISKYVLVETVEKKWEEFEEGKDTELPAEGTLTRGKAVSRILKWLERESQHARDSQKMKTLQFWLAYSEKSFKPTSLP